MKFSYRKPNLEKTIKGRTTGRARRAFKRSVDPTYGKKGMGYIKDPQKAMYSKGYNKKTRSVTKDLQFIGKNAASTAGCVGCVGCFPIPFTFVLIFALML